MGKHTVGAILDAAFGVGERTTAAFSEGIERTPTEQTVEVFRMGSFMAGKTLTVFIAKKRICLVVPIVHISESPFRC